MNDLIFIFQNLTTIQIEHYYVYSIPIVFLLFYIPFRIKSLRAKDRDYDKDFSLDFIMSICLSIVWPFLIPLSILILFFYILEKVLSLFKKKKV